MKLTVRRTTQFKRDMKRLLGSGKDIEKLLSVVEILAEGHSLPSEYKDHTLRGKYANKRDCHVEPDWILIYAIEHDEVVLYRTGSHSELFR
ncbi:MAG: type II toxin-antitoxin system YafQ family toxin [Deltaproteobacteria bacterium]|nr:type II toxin-antitoxin system YafQ family toxin [Deltaproteobacteria bacterium]